LHIEGVDFLLITGRKLKAYLMVQLCRAKQFLSISDAIAEPQNLSVRSPGKIFRAFEVFKDQTTLLPTKEFMFPFEAFQLVRAAGFASD
jgi:hypothetical protein